MTDHPKSHTPKDSHYARLRRAHRDQAAGGPAAPSARPPKPQHAGRPAPADRVRLYGIHTVQAALANPRRRFMQIYVTRNALNRLELDENAAPCPIEIVEPRFLDQELGSDAVHQGVLLETAPLKPARLDDLGETDLVLVLDQVTDPHNVGAILRSAVAFGAGAVVTTSRHSPQESGVLAKSASGALELISYVQVTNLADALVELKERGYRTIGLDSAGDDELEPALDGGKLALVLGSEGKGLRQKTRETVDVLARLEVPGAIRSLNVSNAAAVSLYAARRHLKG
ncbi:23S rRNA (guanosine(2251)-2'-O)-methyltransferase RlmB [Aureimonas sp. Leaf324]|jgi:23S rRNA (guanosine2251-2'-O)-methyltransferase|uniref:23S rRNA (guanosine(2251)-2'-O)-methyltransferase RlmB n=1 Tax=Aureimonas sp. Leaf324 TaxID=1736336 RepID=UPI00070007BF|nr:23S rRNA (guanosine(2251)-2'-O)-methyltransferase RlmB [Aureimonas sp. Leaf324]KQQ85093.1 RNA methyltransferase [Aureimonas sp. Leaf324]